MFGGPTSRHDALLDTEHGLDDHVLHPLQYLIKVGAFFFKLLAQLCEVEFGLGRGFRLSRSVWLSISVILLVGLGLLVD